MNKQRLMMVFMVIVLFSSGVDAKALAQKYTKLDAVSNGYGKVQFRWMTPPEFWPKKGWALVDSKSNKTIKQINLSDTIVKLYKNTKIHTRNKKVKQAFNVTMFEVFVSYERAKEHGFAFDIKAEGYGKRAYKLVSLDNKKIVLRSQKIDAYKASPLPGGASRLKAKNSAKAVELFWQKEPKSLYAPVSYRVYRKNSKGIYELRTIPSILTGVNFKSDKPLFTDAVAPLEKRITYQVYGIDTFDRKSKPATVTTFHPDVEALYAPQNVKAEIKKGAVVITWQPNPNPFTAGYVIERGTKDGGFFDLLTPKPLKKSSGQFIDKSIIKNINYLYRVRSVNLRGEQGKASKLAVARLMDNTLPEAAQELKAKVYPSMVTLTWQGDTHNLLGYIVQKKYVTQPKWVDLNSDPINRYNYTDKIAYEAIGEVFYRIVTVGTNGKMGESSDIIKVRLPGNLKVYAPNIETISGQGAKVTLTYTLAAVGAKVSKVMVLRGNRSQDTGHIVATLSPAEKQFSDTNVRIGEDYWYALKAVDKRGIESKMGNKLLVRVMPTAIAKPAQPKAVYRSKPFKHVKLSFEEPPHYMYVVVYAQKGGDEVWTIVARHIQGTSFIDSNLLDVKSMRYKIAYTLEDGTEGEVSKPIKIMIDK